ncbi:MAG: magnesium transporter CorA family protein [Clostridiales bacterium]|jgi:magnesium transporter|nr:magnesium transporter CorA family protein [Clostridiales bacterium]
MMRGYDFSAGKVFDGNLPAPIQDSDFVAICNSNDIHSLVNIFGWDEDTVEECTNLDETVRYTSYEQYDFISLIYLEEEGGTIYQQEVNIFFAKNYLVLVLPAETAGRLSKLASRIAKAVPGAAGKTAPILYIYYSIFDSLATDFSDMLEGLEDEMEALSENIESKPSQGQSKEIGRLRRVAYAYKKQLRALSYIGGQILMDKNGLLIDKHMRYFRNIDTRLLKLYDFADSLFDLSNELLHAYDSKFSAQMNETVNKLTVITLFFGPPTLIAGIYGMNFVNMPELGWIFGYPAALGLMAIVSIFIYILLKKKKWV